MILTEARSCTNSRTDIIVYEKKNKNIKKPTLLTPYDKSNIPITSAEIERNIVYSNTNIIVLKTSISASSDRKSRSLNDARIASPVTITEISGRNPLTP